MFGYGILSHVTAYFSFGWFEIFPYLSFGGYKKDKFCHLVAVLRTTSLRPLFVDSADFSGKTTNVQCRIPYNVCDKVLISYDI